MAHRATFFFIVLALASLRSEIFALQSLEGQLLQDIQSMEQRRRTLELSGTFKGRALALVGYLFTFYCVARVVLSAVSLLFGLDREAAPNSDSGAAGEEPRSQNLSHLLAAFISIVGLNVDVATWSRLVSLALIGVIILVNMRVVLSSVYRVSLSWARRLAYRGLLSCGSHVVGLQRLSR